MASLWLIISIFTFAILHKLLLKKRIVNPRPPGPRGWPVIGNIFDVGTMPHQSFYKLKAKYGPVLWLKLGMTNTLVIQSAKAAEELIKKHDVNLADRKVPDCLTADDYDMRSLVLARHGEYWRVIRKLCSSELLAQKRISGSAPVRRMCIDIMMQQIKEDSATSILEGGSGEVQLDRYLMNMMFNLVSNFTMSRDVMGSKSSKGNEFYDAMNGFLDWNGKPNLVDSFPFLKRVDPQGIRRNSGKYMGQLHGVIDGFVEERVQERKLRKGNGSKDFLDVLLEFDGIELPRKNVNTLIQEMFMAGTETSSATINWAIAELLRNPESLTKLRDEIDHVIGPSRSVEEDDINRLPYLQAVVKETMRLHPSLPLLLPRNVTQDIEYMGYHIPKETMVFLNVWAIHRDPDSWEDPLSFKPERFIGSNIDSHGRNFELLPFGAGRRICIGILLGDVMVSITLAKLVQTFDWKLPANASEKMLDMQEKMGISLRKLVPLEVIPVERNF